MSKMHDDRMKRGLALLKKMGRLENLQGRLRQNLHNPETYDLSVGHVFGEIWTRPNLSLRDRQLVTLATNIALVRPRGNQSHYQNAIRLGITEKQIVEVIIQVATYAGWPVVTHAMHQFREALEESAAVEQKNVPRKKRSTKKTTRRRLTRP